jgi:branched-chain amino acid transport system ATP-binding protein
MLRVKNLEAAYGPLKVLRKVSLHIAPGEIVTVIGANGAGKTTLLKTISGLLPARGGEILFERLILGASVQYRRKRQEEIAEDMGRVFGLFPRLKEREKQLAGTLSGGEQQMLAIGRALLSRPRLLLLDEPSMGLAPRMVREIFAHIAGLRKKFGLTILLVEQNARGALRVADRGYVLETGRIILQGPSEELLSNKDVQRAYLGRSPEGEA